MSPELVAQLAALVLSGACVLLLLAVFIQLDMERYRPPTYASSRPEWAEDFANVRRQIPEWIHIGRPPRYLEGAS
jgi:hypothetical protein